MEVTEVIKIMREADAGIAAREAQNQTQSSESNVPEDVVERVLANLPEEETLYDLAELFKIFGDSTRIRILSVLSEAEMCVSDIADILNMSQSSVSHQLRILKNSKLVKFRREGKSMYYSLDDEHVRLMISMGLEHLSE